MDGMKEALRNKRMQGVDLLITIVPAGEGNVSLSEMQMPGEMKEEAPVEMEASEESSKKLGIAPPASEKSKEEMPSDVAEVSEIMEDESDKGIRGMAKRFWAGKKGQ